MNASHTTQDYNNDWRIRYNRVRLSFTKEYLLKVKTILIKIYHSQETNTTNMYAMMNGTTFSRFTVVKEAPSILPLESTIDILDKNVIEIGIADEDENKGAIFKPYDLKKCFSVLVER